MNRRVLVRSARTLHKLIENMADKTELSEYRVRLSKLQSLAVLSPTGDNSPFGGRQKPPKRTANLKTASLKPRSTVALLKRTADLKLNDSKVNAEVETKSFSDSKLYAEVEAKSVVDSRHYAEVETISLHDSKANAQVETISFHDSKANAQLESKPFHDSKANAQLESKPFHDSKANAQLESKPVHGSKANVQVETKSFHDLKVKAQAETKPVHDSKLTAEVETKSPNQAESIVVENHINDVTLSVVSSAKTESSIVEIAPAVNEVATEVVSVAKKEVEIQIEDVSTSRSKSVPQLSESRSKQTAPFSKHPSQPKLRNGTSSNSPFTRKPAATTSTTLRQTQPRRALASASKRGVIGTIEELAAAIQTGKVTRVIVMCGAGISTASGIPDFRTPGTGLYSNLQKYNLPYPEAIFDIDYFEQNPKPFFTLAKELYPSGKYMPNAVHYFFKLLHEQNRLFRIYTQNIDGLERMAGVPPSMLVEAHGTFATATCTYCGARYAGDEIREDVFAGRIPHCRDSNSCSGVIKPDIVFFGEDLPIKFYTYLRDFLQADALFVLGTSLNVEPFASILNAVRFGVPRVLFNREAVGPFTTRTRPHDFTMLGDLVSTVTSFCDMLGWRPQLDALLNVSPSAEEFSKRFFVHDKPKSRSPNGAGNGGTGSRNSSNSNPSRTFGTFTRSSRLAANVLPAITAASPALGRNRPASSYSNAKTGTRNGPILRRPAVQRGNAHINQPVAINRWIWRQDSRLTYDSEESDETESESTDSDS